MTEQRLRDLYSHSLEVRQPDGQCPPPEALLALARRAGLEGTRLETLDHVMRCNRCRSELDLLRAIEKAGGSIATEPRRRRHLALAMAAALLLAVGVGPLLRYWQHDASEPTRGPSAALALLAPAAGEVATVPVTFVWRPLPQARGYTFELLTGDGTVAFSARTSDTVLVTSAARTLAPGLYRWWVRGTAADGRERRSDLRALRIRG
jgi:hypothetical protein